MEKNKFHILVVDDDDKIRNLIKQFLNEKGFIVSTAINAENAKLKIDIFNFNLIILDVMMPGQTGYDLTKELKQSKNVPIILLTAKGEVENRIHGLELGADDYLGKPFEPQELLLRVKNIIKMNTNINALESTKIGEAELNLGKMTIKLNKKVKKINSSEKNVLVKMLSSPGRVFSRSEIGKISKISKIPKSQKSQKSQNLKNLKISNNLKISKISKPQKSQKSQKRKHLKNLKRHGRQQFSNL